MSYQNVGIFGFAQGTNASFGYAAGIMGIGGQANSLRAIGVYAGLGGAPATIPSTDAALYSDAASLGYSGIFMNGDVGIGTASPIFKTHILGDDGVAEHGLLIDGDGESSDIPFRVRSNVVVSSITDADTKFIIKGNGNVGIGTSSPGTKLEVAGQVKITGGTPGVDQVLTSDASGLATWETPGANNDNWSLSAKLAYSEDDISGWTTLSGDDSYVNITLPFSITIGGTSYSIVHLSTNGWLEFFTSGGGTVTDASNDCLPSTSHSNPMLCWFWDDLVPNGTNIRYTTLGTSPNRVFFIDFDVNIWSTTDDIEGMIQIHEGSALMNVSYKETLDAGARGQTATIGFQLAGGASAKVYPIGCNVAVIDDNQAFESGWSVCPAR
ncbi:MAG: hypothetical protein COA57_03455 [Flavobacteriales bacterium]|nr:MAG: hypothetical protein COA57_03455 [Flavobacteriales bacterium]